MKTAFARLWAWFWPADTAARNVAYRHERDLTWKQRQIREATARWRVHNEAARLAGCRCGRPATHVTYDHGNVGAVPVEFWTCEEHVGVNAWSGDQPLWDRATPCAACPYRGGDRHCGGTIGPIGGPPRVWHCTTKPSEAR